MQLQHFFYQSFLFAHWLELYFACRRSKCQRRVMQEEGLYIYELNAMLHIHNLIFIHCLNPSLHNLRIIPSVSPRSFALFLPSVYSWLSGLKIGRDSPWRLVGSISWDTCLHALHNKWVAKSAHFSLQYNAHDFSVQQWIIRIAWIYK